MNNRKKALGDLIKYLTEYQNNKMLNWHSTITWLNVLFYLSLQ